MHSPLKVRSSIAATAIVMATLGAGNSSAQDLRESVQAAVDTNPEILQAVHNKNAIEQERRQAQGLRGPRVSVEASGGLRLLENDTRRSLGIADDTLYPVEGSLVVEQPLWDFGRAKAEIARQASRTDGAASRVEERSEFIALNVSRAYLDYLLQQRLVAAAQDNIAFHEKLTNDLRQGVSQGSISIADQQQAEERLQAARTGLVQAREELANAEVVFRQLTGIPITRPTMPTDVRGRLPAGVDQAVEQALAHNPLVLEASADIDAARAEVWAAKAERSPRISLEGRARAGDDVDGFDGYTEDYQGRVVVRWTLFDSGITNAKVREMQSRQNEARSRFDAASRQAEADVRSAWARLEGQRALFAELQRRSQISDSLLVSYREQFNIGRRSLLDVLDAQNTRYNVLQQSEAARMAEQYAQYRVLAASNQLVETLGVTINPAAVADARRRYGVEATTPATAAGPQR